MKYKFSLLLRLHCQYQPFFFTPATALFACARLSLFVLLLLLLLLLLQLLYFYFTTEVLLLLLPLLLLRLLNFSRRALLPPAIRYSYFPKGAAADTEAEVTAASATFPDRRSAARMSRARVSLIQRPPSRCPGPSSPKPRSEQSKSEPIRWYRTPTIGHSPVTSHHTPSWTEVRSSGVGSSPGRLTQAKSALSPSVSSDAERKAASQMSCAGSEPTST